MKQDTKDPMTSMNISVPESMKEFIEEEVSSGGYGTASEYVREFEMVWI
jgi:antitoxin ParD1/3/4